MGFDGKTIIHPKQLAICNAAFSPSAAQVERAKAIVAAFALPENAGKGVIKLDGADDRNPPFAARQNAALRCTQRRSETALDKTGLAAQDESCKSALN